jgi:sugar phosphate isomerase/epimerase
MILSVSNIAWAPDERMTAYDQMVRSGLTGLEIAPTLFFDAADDPFDPDTAAAEFAMSEIVAHGISLVSMQSLLFGVQGAALFGDTTERAAFKKGMTRAIDLAGRFGIPNIVFGSPKNRGIPDGMTQKVAWAQGADIFRRLGDRAAAAGTVIAMETNPKAYGTNFLNTLEETVAFVALVDHPAVTLILDLGAMHMNGTYDSVSAQVGKLMPLMTHVHVSEPHLAPAPDASSDLRPVLLALRDAGYAGAVSIEMKRPEDGVNALDARFKALARAARAKVHS